MSLLKLVVPFDVSFHNQLDMPTAHKILRNGMFSDRGLSRTEKLNCYSWGIPTKYCKTGSKLSEIKGTVCKGCNIKRGHFTTPIVKTCYQQRYDAWLEQPNWIEAITYLIKNLGYDLFRWFESGDIQDEYMILQMIEVANRLPKKRFWIPT